MIVENERFHLKFYRIERCDIAIIDNKTAYKWIWIKIFFTFLSMRHKKYLQPIQQEQSIQDIVLCRKIWRNSTIYYLTYAQFNVFLPHILHIDLKLPSFFNSIYSISIKLYYCALCKYLFEFHTLLNEFFQLQEYGTNWTFARKLNIKMKKTFLYLYANFSHFFIFDGYLFLSNYINEK